ncbi:MAG: ABC transporter substrate-binding protein [Candidatus Methanoperedens sp.]|nr:ABC transporter substrate-binding protein [Candidatus Methanoperedens sp.]MCZ7371384.1 ABC transporter substrate-binding protein [Candidatus Methanoperedens sp.]
MKKYVYAIIVVLIVASAGIIIYEKSQAKRTIYVVSMTADEMSRALKNGTIKGFISWEPYDSKAVTSGYGRYLVNSRDIWNNHPSCIIAISEDLKDEDMIRALLWAHMKGTRFINDPANREKVLKYGSEFTGVDRTTVSEAINNTVYQEFPDLKETKKGFEILNEAGTFKKSQDYNDLDGFLSSIILDRYYNDIRKKLEDNPDWAPPAVNGSMRFGYLDGNLHELAMYVAEKEGYFEKAGLVPGKNIQFIGYRNGLAIMNAFDHREVDAATLGMTPVLRYRINDNGRVNIIGGVNSGGSSLIVGADSDINSIDDLNGNTIATPGFGSCQDVVMRKMFEGFEIKAK